MALPSEQRGEMHRAHGAVAHGGSQGAGAFPNPQTHKLEARHSWQAYFRPESTPPMLTETGNLYCKETGFSAVDMILLGNTSWMKPIKMQHLQLKAC